MSAARGRLGQDPFDGGDAIAVRVLSGLGLLQPAGTQRVLLGGEFLVQFDQQGQHALPDLQDLRDHLRRGTRRQPARGRLRPNDLVRLVVTAVDDLLELPPALCYQAEELRLAQILRKKEIV